MVAVALLWSCGGSRKSADDSSRYQREPVTEVSRETLAIEELMIDATTRQVLGYREEAIGLYRKVLQKDPNVAAAHYEIGKVMMQMGWLDSALYHTQQAVKTDRKNVWYQLQLAQIYQQRQDGKNLSATWEQIVKDHPNVVEYYYNLSNAYLLMNDVPKSIEVLDRVEKRYGVTEEVSMQKQRLWMAINKPEKARKELEKLAKGIPNDTRYNAIVAENYMTEKNYRQALVYYNNILANAPDDENIHIALADCYRQLGETDQVYRHLRAGLMHPALDCKTRLMYAGEMLRDEAFFKAYAHPMFGLIDTLVAECPKAGAHSYAYGLILAAQERYAEAATQLDGYLNYDSSKYEVWESLMYCVSMQPDHEKELMGYAQRASKLFPLHVRPYYIRAALLHAEGDYDGALELLRRCENLGFSKGVLQVETYHLMADCLNRKGEYQRAFDYYERCVKLTPDDPFVLNSYAYALAEQKRELDKAGEMARKALKALPDDPNILDTYGWILYHQHRCSESLEQMEKAVQRLKGSDETIMQHYEEIKANCK